MAKLELVAQCVDFSGGLQTYINQSNSVIYQMFYILKYLLQ